MTAVIHFCTVLDKKKADLAVLHCYYNNSVPNRIFIPDQKASLFTTELSFWKFTSPPTPKIKRLIHYNTHNNQKLIMLLFLIIGFFDLFYSLLFMNSKRGFVPLVAHPS